VDVLKNKPETLDLDFANELMKKENNMQLVKMFTENDESIFGKSREHIQLLIDFFSENRSQFEKTMAELKSAERIWQTSVPGVISSEYLW